MGYDSEQIALILNRADSRVGITPEDVSTIVGRTPDVFVPSDREIPRSINEGTPIVAVKPGSGAAKAFRDLADRYAKTSHGQAGGERRRFRRLRTLIGRRR